ncbi:MAG: DUF6029 family protein [Bacteroidales bacterium]|nr:DUF6029 family protein [Bacteroidales bacterium]
MKNIKLNLSFLLILFIFPIISLSQDFLNNGKVHGSFQVDVQNYNPDTKIGIYDSIIDGEKLAMMGFANIIYTNQNFTAGIRYESYLNPLIGFDEEYEGSGIAYRFASYKKGAFDITVGNYYEQFGNGLIFRTYEEWSLGYDNSMDGIRVKINPYKGITLKGIYGTQRYYWEKYTSDNRGIVRGADGELFLNDVFNSMKDQKTKIILGASIISKYQKDDPYALYKYPENVSACAGRINLTHGKVNLLSEYAYKINDPSSINNIIYKNGEALLISATYSQKGLGILLSAKHIDNMSFKSNRTETGNALDINYLPPLSKQHTYSLEAMYPYATQPNGEIGFQAQVVYTIPKKSKLGGKYGTNIIVNFSQINSLDKQQLNEEIPIDQKGTKGYKSSLFAIGDEIYYEDFNVEISKKINKKWKAIIAYTNLLYNYDVIEEGFEGGKKYYANIGVIDLTYKIKPKKSIRLELQYLETKQDSGNWAMALIEYTIAPKWFFAIFDQYNYNNPVSNNTYHYYNVSAGYINKTNRVAISYGRQREGILCIGGVCRRVPASSGFTLTITSSF